MVFSFEKLSISFKKGEQQVTLQGVGESPVMKTMAVQTLSKWLKRGEEVDFGQLMSLQMNEIKEELPGSVQTFLDEYKDLLEKPVGLPPSRNHEHVIQLTKDAQPFKARPYRYPHLQKCEIEKLVKEMLEDGIIRTSKSPFASPVVLVKKKDGTWREAQN